MALYATGKICKLHAKLGTPTKNMPSWVLVGSGQPLWNPMLWKCAHTRRGSAAASPAGSSCAQISTTWGVGAPADLDPQCTGRHVLP